MRTTSNAPGATPVPGGAPVDPGHRIAEELMRLRAAGGFDPQETSPGAGTYSWRFRAAGWPVDVVLDDNVLEMRVYHDRDEVAMTRIPLPLMRVLLGRDPVVTDGPAPKADDVLAELRKLVAGWKDGNARIFVTPPQTVGNADGWNRA